MSMTRKQAMKDLKALAASYDIRLIFSWNIISDGWADLKTELVTISSQCTIHRMICATCHEICHILNEREGKYPIYHNYKNWECDELVPYFLSTAHRAELYTEWRGKKLMKKHYPKLKYRMSYKRTAESKNWLKGILTGVSK